VSRTTTRTKSAPAAPPTGPLRPLAEWSAGTRISVRKLRRAIAAGDLVAYKPGTAANAHWMVAPSDFAAYLASIASTSRADR
jgi:hypothetical protein